MRTGKKLLTGMLLVLFIVFVAGCGKTGKNQRRTARRCATAARRFSGNTAMKPTGATLWHLPSCEVLPEKTARTELTAPTERTASTVKTVLTAKTALTAKTEQTAKTEKTEQTARTALMPKT